MATNSSTPALTHEIAAETIDIPDENLATSVKSETESGQTSDTPATKQTAQSSIPPSAPDSIPAAVQAEVAAAAEQKTIDDGLPQLSEAQMTKLLAGIKRKLKVDGTDIEVSLSELESGYGLKRVSDARLQEAAKLRTQVAEVIKLFQSNPRAALKHPLVKADERKLAEEILNEALEEEMLSPAERENRALKRELRERQEADAAAKAAAEKAEIDAAESAQLAAYEKEIPEAFTKVGIPYNDFTLERMKRYIGNGIDAGYDVRPGDVADLVAEDYRNEIRKLVSVSSSEQLTSLLGEEGLKKVRQADISRLKQPVPTVPVAAQPPAKAEHKSKGKKQTLSEFFEELHDGK